MSKTKLTLLTALLVLMVVSLTVLVPSGAVTDEALSRYEDALWEQEEDEEEYGDAQELQDNVNTDEKRGTPSLKPGHKREKRAVEKEKNHEIESFEDDDLDDFKIG